MIVAGTGKIKSTVGIYAWKIKNNWEYYAHAKTKESYGNPESKVVILFILLSWLSWFFKRVM